MIQRYTVVKSPTPSQMGVRGLLTFCKVNKIIKHANTGPQGPMPIGLDAFSLFYLFQERRDDFESYLQNLSKLGSLTIVLDKRASKEKAQVVKERKEARKEASHEVKNLQSTIQNTELDPQQKQILEKQLAQQQRKAWCLYAEYMEWALKTFQEVGATVEWAEQEADEVLARGGFAVVVSSDSDLLLLGVKTLWIPRGVGIQHSEITREAFQKIIGLRGNQLYELAFLAGCDVQPETLMPITKARSLLIFYKNLETIHIKLPQLVTQDHLDLFRRLRTGVWLHDLV